MARSKTGHREAGPEAERPPHIHLRMAVRGLGQLLT